MPAPGLIAIPCPDGYDAALARLDAALAAHGIQPLARIDHAAAARAAGLALPPLLLILFGNPKLGTPLMQAHPSLGIDLPLKLLLWEERGTCYIGYTDPHWLAERHGGGTASPEILATMRGLLDQLAQATAG